MKMSLVRPLFTRRGFSTSSDNLVASVLFQRLPLVIDTCDLLLLFPTKLIIILLHSYIRELKQRQTC
ncbi:hypothetical protein GLYMA_U031114v4 [Glycine max]|uniref:Uncharacterized protein n=1 Tax=Glycine max TaxID=3847 RepID=K7L014_SOYBN|nr:hypothetical protein GLYMA_U031114v4 [Glycine max]